MNIKEKLFNFIKNIFVNNLKENTKCKCNCKCNCNVCNNIYLYDLLFNNAKYFNEATKMLAAHFSSIELMEKLKKESGELDFSPEVLIENNEMDIILICILGHQSDEEKVKFLKYLKDTYHISFNKEFQEEFSYLYWAYILRLKKTFKFLLENGAPRIVKRYEYEPNENESSFVKFYYSDILELIEPSEKYFIKLLNDFENKNKKQFQKKKIKIKSKI